MRASASRDYVEHERDKCEHCPDEAQRESAPATPLSLQVVAVGHLAGKGQRTSRGFVPPVVVIWSKRTHGFMLSLNSPREAPRLVRRIARLVTSYVTPHS